VKYLLQQKILLSYLKQEEVNNENIIHYNTNSRTNELQ